MNKFQFSTNINCSGCVAKISPVMNSTEGIKEWNVETAHPSKILTVQSEKLNEEEVKNLVSMAGFKAENLNAPACHTTEGTNK